MPFFFLVDKRMMGLQHILKFIQPLNYATCCLEFIFPPQRHPSWSPSSSCSSLEWLLFRPAVQLSAWDLPTLPSWVGSTVSWIPCLPLSWFSPLFCWSALSGNFLNSGYVGGIYIVLACLKMPSFCPYT